MGSLGHFALRHWPLYPDKTVTIMIAGSSSRVESVGSDASLVQHIYNSFVLPELTALEFSSPSAPALSTEAGIAPQGGGGAADHAGFEDQDPNDPDLPDEDLLSHGSAEDSGGIGSDLEEDPFA